MYCIGMSDFNEIVEKAFGRNHYHLYFDVGDKPTHAIQQILKFLVTSKGSVIDETIDLHLVLHSITSGQGYSFSVDEIESIISLSSELEIINYIKTGQNLTAIEIGEDAPVFTTAKGLDDLTLELCICLSSNRNSKFNNADTLASLSLFGKWEWESTILLDAVMHSNRTTASVQTTKARMSKMGLKFSDDLEYVDFLRKLHAVNLITIKTNRAGIGQIRINIPSAGLFLVMSNNIEAAKKLATISP